MGFDILMVINIMMEVLYYPYHVVWQIVTNTLEEHAASIFQFSWSRFIKNSHKQLQNYTVSQARTVIHGNHQSGPFVMSCAWQLYGTENLHVLSHPTTAAVLRT
jgi:hypothetical protein